MRMKMFEGTELGKIGVKNRLVRSATFEQAGNADGRYTQAMCDIYEKLARGGVGLIVTGMVDVDENARISPQMIKTYDDTFAEGLL